MSSEKPFNVKFIDKPAGFWIRFIARSFDFLILLITAGLPLIGFTNPQPSKVVFKENYFFYIWILITIVCLTLIFVVIPLFFKGRTLGYMLCKIKVKWESDFIRSFLLREAAFGLWWIASTISVMIIINHTLINQISQISNGTDMESKLSNWQKSRIALTGTFASIMVTVEMVLAITIFPDPNKRGFHDKVAKCAVIYENKKVKITTPNLFIDRKTKAFQIIKYNLTYKGSIKDNDIKW